MISCAFRFLDSLIKKLFIGVYILKFAHGLHIRFYDDHQLEDTSNITDKSIKYEISARNFMKFLLHDHRPTFSDINFINSWWTEKPL